jgi:hypothetical protein
MSRRLRRQLPESWRERFSVWAVGSRLHGRRWRVTPSGLPVGIDGEPTVTVTADVNCKTVMALRAEHSIEKVDPWLSRPYVPAVPAAKSDQGQCKSSERQTDECARE